MFLNTHCPACHKNKLLDINGKKKKTNNQEEK